MPADPFSAGSPLYPARVLALSPTVRAYVGVILTVIIWGANVVAIKALLLHFTPADSVAGRLAVAALVLLGLNLWRHGWPRWDVRTWAQVAGAGLLGSSLFQWAFVVGVERSPAGIAGLTNSVVPVAVVLLGLALRQWPTWRQALGVAVSLGGMLLLLDLTRRPGSALDPVGLAFLVLAAVIWALYTLANRPLAARLGTLPFVAFSLALGCLPTVLPNLPHLVRTSAPPWAWGLMVACGLLANVFAFLAWADATKLLGAARTSIWQNVAPLVALGLGAALLGERLGWPVIASAAVILAGVLLTNWPARGVQVEAEAAPAD